MQSKQGTAGGLYSCIENTEAVQTITEGSHLVFWYVLALWIQFVHVQRLRLGVWQYFVSVIVGVPRSLLSWLMKMLTKQLLKMGEVRR